jgi:hypothetical protein
MIRKLQCTRDSGGAVFIECPGCGRKQELPLSDEWYGVDRDGKVSPVFVCLARSSDRYDCHWEGDIWIVNWTM